MRKLKYTSSEASASLFMLMKYLNLIEIDLSGCINFNATEFVDVIRFAKYLKVIKLDGCTQFNQYQYVKMFSNLLEIESISLTNCQKLAFTPAYCISSSLRQLRRFYFEADNLQSERRDWGKFRAIFFIIDFGDTFRNL